MPLGVERPVDALRQRQFRIDRVPRVLGQPAGTVERAARLLAAADQIIDPYRETIARPILALGLGHIDVGEHPHRFGFRVGAVQHRPQPAFPRMPFRDEHPQIRIRIAGRFQPPAMRCAARVQSPAERVVLVSTRSL